MNPQYFYRKAKPLGEEQDHWKPMELNRQNWWFVQLNATITTTFFTYRLTDPPHVFVEDAVQWGDETPKVNIYVVRPSITTPEEFERWLKMKIYIEYELKRQADENSDEERVKYSIEII